MLFYKTVLNIIIQFKCLFLIKILDIKTKLPIKPVTANHTLLLGETALGI